MIEAPDTVFERGLTGRGENLDLQAHAEGARDSAFRGGTSYIFSPDREQGAALWAGEGGWVYEIDGVGRWDVNSALEGRVKRPDGTFGGNLMRGEGEKAFLASVPRERIVRAIPIIERNGQLARGEAIANPHHKKPEGKP